MSATSNLKPDSKVLWRQVWGLSVLIAAIVFSWMAYGFYQPLILEKLGFIALAANLGILQGFLGALVEPLVGGASDRVMHRCGSRLPVIATGVTLAGLIFVAVALLMQGELPVGLRWLVPVLMTVWVMAMIVFRGPAIALLRQFAPTAQLPKANAILTLVFGLVGALGPLISMLLQGAGAFLTFLLGAGALVAGALLLYASKPQLQLTSDEPAQHPVPLRTLLWMFGVGLGTGMVLNLVLRVFPAIALASAPTFRADFVAAALLLVSAVTAIPLETVTHRWGAHRAMLVGLAMLIGLLGLAIALRGELLNGLLILALGTAFGLVFISQIPFALGIVPPSQAGFSTGLYFGGIGATTAFVSLLQQASELAPLTEWLWAIAGFAIAATSITRLHHLKNA